MMDYLQYQDTYWGKIIPYINYGMSGHSLCITMSEASNEGNTLIEYSFYKYAGRQVMKINLDTAPPSPSQDSYYARGPIMDIKSFVLDKW